MTGKLPQSLRLNECPFCNGRELMIHMTSVAWATCNGCNAEGPIKKTPRMAVNAWNKAQQRGLFNAVIVTLSEDNFSYESNS